MTPCACSIPTVPTLPTAYLVAAATALAAPGDRVVLGPATDGGYYLIGLKQPIAGFSRTSTGAPSGCSARRWRARTSWASRSSLLPSWYDVDARTPCTC